MRLVTAAEMRAIDRKTIDEIGVPAALLMEHAGRAVADEVARAAAPGARVAVVCGSGNNGGDGFVCARWLRERGFRATVLLARGRPRAGGEAALHLAIYEKLDGPVTEITDPEAALAGADVIVDAVLGTGLGKDVEGPLAAILAAINASPALRIAVDVPSGMDSDTGRILGVAVKAARTVTLGLAKVGLLSHPGCELAGVVRVADIGIPACLAEDVRCRLLEAEEVARLLPRRAFGDHKGTTGHVVVCAGSTGKAGAALLAASGALRGGAGLVTIATPPDAVPLVAGRLLEAMVTAFDPAAPRAEALAALVALVTGKRALVWGPGMPTQAVAGDLVRAAMGVLEVPMILDADALNHLAVDPTVLQHARVPVILAHPGEAARLLGTDTRAVQSDRLGAARRLASSTAAVVVLKGARTVIAAPDGTAAVNPTGNPGMATGGTGDVLAGLIGALIAQGLEAFAAACAGAFVHGRAGDLAVEKGGQVGMLAGDLATCIPSAMASLWS